jgi:predicted DNA-binding transcriptional regulator AlpA
MNATSRAILQTVLSTDASLSAAERNAAQRLISGQSEAPTVDVGYSDERLLVTQKQAAEMLGVSRVTIWRMTKDCMLHPVEILPGTWRYPCHEILALARRGIAAESIADGGRGQSAA